MHFKQRMFDFQKRFQLYYNNYQWDILQNIFFSFFIFVSFSLYKHNVILYQKIKYINSKTIKINETKWHIYLPWDKGHRWATADAWPVLVSLIDHQRHEDYLYWRDHSHWNCQCPHLFLPLSVVIMEVVVAFWMMFWM